MADANLRLDKIEAKLDQLNQRQMERSWKIEEFEKKIDDHSKQLERQRGGAITPSSFLGESNVVRVVIYALIGLVVALATGQAINLRQLIGGG